MAQGVSRSLSLGRGATQEHAVDTRVIRTFAVDRRPLRRSGLARIARSVGAGPALALSDLEQLATVRELTAGEAELVLLGLEAGDDPRLAVDTARWLAGRVVVVVEPADRGLGQRALDAGADGYLLSDGLGADTLSRALGLIATGRRAVPQGVDVEVGASGAASPARVTDRGRQVLALLSEGLHDDEVATALGISTSSVRKHLASAQERLGARTRTQAVAVAAREGLF